jgi:hypothetical protein
MAGSGFKSQYRNLANERGVMECLAVQGGFISWGSEASA